MVSKELRGIAGAVRTLHSILTLSVFKKMTYFDHSRRRKASAMEYVEVTDTLAGLVGQHEAFAKTKKQVKQMKAKCRNARQALEQHWKEHGCRDG
jgi:hypothetical protein